MSDPYQPPPAAGYYPPMSPGAAPLGQSPMVPPAPLPPAAPPPTNYPALGCTVPDPSAAARYAEALAAYPQITALPTVPQPPSAYETAYTQLPPERFYQFKMWLQSPEGQNYTAWETEARALLEVIEPFNARWLQGWINAELQLLRPLHDYLDIYDQYTRQLLTHADLNPAARHAQLYGANDPLNPLPYEILAQRLPERTALQERFTSYDEFWREHFGIEFATGWRTSWGAGQNEPFALANGIRSITGSVTSRLWSAAELPELPPIPSYAPTVTGLPRSMTALQQQILQATTGTELAAHTQPEPFHPGSYPTPMAPANPRWGRSDFFTGRAVVHGRRAPWAEAVALEVAFGHAGATPSVCVQRYDGSVGWFAVNEIFGIR